MPESSAINTVFFDIGGVLLDVDVHFGLAEIAGVTGLDMDWLDQRLGGEPLYVLERGQCTLREYYEAVFKDAPEHTPLPYPQFRRIWLGVLKAEMPLTSLVPRLKEQVRIWYLSNSNRVHIDYVRENYPFMELADGVISSHEVSCRKPGREIFDLALQRAGTQASQALFVDDKPENVAAARELGIRAHHYTDLPELVDFLSEYGFKVDQAT